ncbi:MAG: DNA cytosine methyltransferase [Deltaproteobacteria bacterium]|nr:DNA cytosine methyltransferase [Deltaproteobacteria bacterium]
MGKRYAISLFSGAGGFDLGIEAAGFSTKLCTDQDPHSCLTLKSNSFRLRRHPRFDFLSEATVSCRDISAYSSSDMLADAGLRAGEVALVYGGPPCQAFSIFGRRKGMDDPRGTLLWEYLRVIKDIRPDCFIFENVPGLLTILGGEIFKRFAEELSAPAGDDPGYGISWHLLDAASFGVPQHRLRLILFGRRGDPLPCPTATHGAAGCNPTGLLPLVTVQDALGSLPEPEEAKLPNHSGRVHGQEVRDRYGSLQYGQRDERTRINRLNPHTPSFTIVVGSNNGGGKGHVHPKSPREVTPRESARLQSFPDFWEFSGMGRHVISQVGNAVPPLFAAALGSHLLREAFGEIDAPGHDALLGQLGLDYLRLGQGCDGADFGRKEGSL